MSRNEKQNQSQQVERVEQNIRECTGVDGQEFDWEQYQYLCDIADYWDSDE